MPFSFYCSGDSSESSDDDSFPLLNGREDYYSWEHKISAHLMIKGLSGYVDGEEVKPWVEVDVAPGETAAEGSSVSDKYVPKEGYTQKDVDSWFIKDEMAIGFILNRVHPSISSSLFTKYCHSYGPTSQELWNEITRKYGTPSKDEIIDEWNSFIHFGLTGKLEDACEFMQKWLAKLGRQRRMGRRISEGDKVFYFMAAVGPAYRQECEAFNRLPVTEQTFYNLYGRIRRANNLVLGAHAASNASRLSNHDHQSPPSARGKGKGRGRNSRRGKASGSNFVVY